MPVNAQHGEASVGLIRRVCAVILLKCVDRMANDSAFFAKRAPNVTVYRVRTADIGVGEVIPPAGSTPKGALADLPNNTSFEQPLHVSGGNCRAHIGPNAG